MDWFKNLYLKQTVWEEKGDEGAREEHVSFLRNIFGHPEVPEAIDRLVWGRCGGLFNGYLVVFLRVRRSWLGV